ncbi:MAG: hypothetical protein JSS20_16295 [Proteobacteria bacterium]|nr:hypothetical protein [Pseudomonadota bacterium]
MRALPANEQTIIAAEIIDRAASISQPPLTPAQWAEIDRRLANKRIASRDRVRRFFERHSVIEY